jgi:hypothetical protein
MGNSAAIVSSCANHVPTPGFFFLVVMEFEDTAMAPVFSFALILF